MAAVAGLLFAAICASAPVLVPGLVLLLVLLMVVQPHRIHRLVTIVVPAAALFAPLVIQQFARGTPFALLADPGVPVVRETPRTLDLLLGSPTSDAAGWTAFADAAGLPWLAGIPGPVVLAITVTPIAVVALLALFLRGGERAIPGLVIAAVGLVTAVASAHLAVSVVDGSAAAIWAGSGLSLYWLGLLGAAAVALDGLGRFAVAPGIVVVLGMVLAVLPLGVAAANGRTELAPSNGRVLPALVTADAAEHPGVGTLELTARGEDSVAAVLHRGSGPLAERVLTLQTTRTFVGPEQERVAVLAGNLVSTSGMDLGPSLDDLGVEYLLLDASGTDSPAYLRAVDAISARPEFVVVGPSAQGILWQRAGDTEPAAPSAGPGPWDTAFGAISALVQIVVFAFALLLAIPTTRRRRVRAAGAGGGIR